MNSNQIPAEKAIRRAMKILTIDNESNIEDAFLYLSEDITLIPPNNKIIHGFEAVKQRIIRDNERPVRSIGGKPVSTQISKSEDLAWEYGTYYIEYMGQEEETMRGYYVSLFKKEEGFWRLKGHSWSEIE